MSWLLRIPLILLLWILVLACVAPALVVTLAQTNHLDVVEKIYSGLSQMAENPSWIEAALLYAAAILFFISSIRLIRRTQAFWAWLLGFAAYGGRWAWVQQQQEGGVAASLQNLSLDSFNPEHLTDGSTAAQIVVLGLILLIGVLLIVLDVFDRRHWDRHAAAN